MLWEAGMAQAIAGVSLRENLQSQLFDGLFQGKQKEKIDGKDVPLAFFKLFGCLHMWLIGHMYICLYMFANTGCLVQ